MLKIILFYIFFFFFFDNLWHMSKYDCLQVLALITWLGGVHQDQHGGSSLSLYLAFTSLGLFFKWSLGLIDLWLFGVRITKLLYLMITWNKE